tara:strand:- start:821 stop:1009 length:189 start_codon:yes stop_codon:yes gene_type:complete
MYEEVKFMAKDEGRTISGQLRMIFEDHKDRRQKNAVSEGGGGDTQKARTEYLPQVSGSTGSS